MLPKGNPTGTGHDAYEALRSPNFRFLIAGSFLNSLATAILSVIVGFELYDRTGSALALGMVGLVQIVPNVLLSIPAGQIVDRYDQKRIAVIALAVNSSAALGLAWLTHSVGPLPLIYACLFVIGTGRAFLSPTRGTLLAAVVNEGTFSNAAAWSSSANQVAMITGPAVGGIAVGLMDNAAPVFAMAGGLLAISAFTFSRMHPRQMKRSPEPVSKESLLAGITFIYSRKVLLAAITLDMVAVLLGGATALLPIFAKDVLHVGAMGLGIMRAAPALGAVLTSIAIAHKGPFLRAGRSLLLTVTCFGIATIIFGFSTWMPLSLVALMFLGVFDSISVVIRNTLQLTYTPDHMRGRVSAIHFVFIGMSNEFGEF
ncbi:MAG TPA: MFS transporter, partial [Thermomicrobiales bacterium]|nr:MFS transporter [Thermomicrobiales bacterium]